MEHVKLVRKQPRRLGFVHFRRARRPRRITNRDAAGFKKRHLILGGSTPGGTGQSPMERLLRSNLCDGGAFQTQGSYSHCKLRHRLNCHGRRSHSSTGVTMTAKMCTAAMPGLSHNRQKSIMRQSRVSSELFRSSTTVVLFSIFPRVLHEVFRDMS